MMGKSRKWIWSKDAGCYIWRNTLFDPPIAYCLGDRHVHVEPGQDTYSIFYRGSTVDNWHGYSFGLDLKRAIEFVRAANEVDMKHNYWNAGSLRRMDPVKIGAFYD